MELVTWTWLMWISWAVAVPLPWESNEENRVRDGSTGTNPKVEQMIPSTQKDPARMAYAVVALICAVVLALVLGELLFPSKNPSPGKNGSSQVQQGFAQKRSRTTSWEK